METSRRTFIGIVGAGAAAGLVDPAFAAETIKIGMTVPMTGPAAENGELQTNGVKLAIDQINAAGGVNGRMLELVREDDQTTNPGIVLAFSRLVNRGDLAVIVSSIRSTQVNAIAADIQKSGIPVFIGGTDPTLTHMGDPWIFRTRPNDTYSAKALADFGVHDLKKTKWAVVYSTDAFGTSGAKLLMAQLKELGITPVLEQGFNNAQTDLTPVVLAVRQSGADALGTYITFENDAALFARQLKQFGVTIPWMGSASLSTTTARDLAGAALYGTYVASDYFMSASPQSKKYFDDFSKAYNRAPDQNSAWAYDAIFLAADAMKRTGGTDPMKLRDALHATSGFPGAEGAYTFDANGDGLRGYNILRNEEGKLAFVRNVSFDK
jgi:branched-chain amino acid transport system substrate-binding protein